MSLRCKCGGKTIVLTTKTDGRYIRRRRECISCKKRFNTYEREAINHNPKNPNEAQKYEQQMQRRFRFIQWAENAEHDELDDLINFIQVKYKPSGAS